MRTVKERFEQKVNVTDGCHLWTACANNKTNGYGLINIDGKMEYAHRMAYELYVGKIPDGLFVLHKCDVRLCCNPEHLFVGTQKENLDDMTRKGRRAKGEGGGTSKLKTHEVLEIRSMAGTKTQTAIAGIFGVSRRLIGLIINRKRWAHL